MLNRFGTTSKNSLRLLLGASVASTENGVKDNSKDYKRNGIGYFVRVYKESRVFHARLPIIEKQTGHIQQEIVNTLALRSGIRWRENGEKAAGVLKRIIKQQTTTQSTLPTIIHPSHWQQL